MCQKDLVINYFFLYLEILNDERLINEWDSEALNYETYDDDNDNKGDDAAEDAEEP